MARHSKSLNITLKENVRAYEVKHLFEQIEEVLGSDAVIATYTDRFTVTPLVESFITKNLSAQMKCFTEAKTIIEGMSFIIDARLVDTEEW